jgi:hypothetical protein
MGKVAKVEQKALAVKAAGDLLDSLNHEPIKNLVGMLNDRFPVPDDPGLLKSMLLTDYEMVEDPDGAPYLRLRRRLAMEIEMELARYKYPRLKASEEGSGKGGGGVTVQILNYGGPQAGDSKTTVELKKL